MKLRRAFLTAAVIAQLALLSTPAASAPREETPTTSTSSPEGASAEAGTEPCVDKKGKSTASGSGPALSMVGLVGGTAVMAGAGAVFVVRRRRTGTGV